MTVFLTTHYLEEAERIAHCIAILDHGKLIALGTPEELMKLTGAQSLEEAYLELTGNTVREEEASGLNQMRMTRAAPGGGRGLDDSMSVVYILWLSQLESVASRSRARIIGSFGQPLLFLVAFGYGFGSVYAKRSGQGNYIQFLAPGMITNVDPCLRPCLPAQIMRFHLGPQVLLPERNV